MASRQTTIFSFLKKSGDNSTKLCEDLSEAELPNTAISSASPIPVNKKNGKRAFQLKWCDEFKWIEYKNSIACCKICAMFPELSDKNSRVVKGFEGPFKIETFRLHNQSNMHQQCESSHSAKHFPHNTPLAKCEKRMNTKMFNHLEKLFTTAFYVAKYNKPFTDFKNLIDLLNKFEVDVSLQEYQNNKQCREFISHIALTLREEIVNEIKQSEHISFLLDGSTDRSTTEELVIYVRYLNEGQVKESFLSLVPLASSTADGYLNAFDDEMQNLGIKWKEGTWTVGIGTDGASTMLGKENGLTAKIKRIIPDVISQHCVAHMLNLSVLSAVGHVKYLLQLDSTLRNLYKFCQNSPKRLKQLKQVGTILEEKVLKFQYLHKIRWVASKVDAIAVLIRNYAATVIHLEEVSHGKGSDAATARGILKKLKSFRFAITLHFLLDFLSVFQEISLTFQKVNLLLSQVNACVEGAVNKLKILESTLGTNELNFVNAMESNGKFKDIQLTEINCNKFVNDKLEIIADGIKYLKKRFLESHYELIGASVILDTFTWPVDELENYGNEDIKTLSRYFKRHLYSSDNFAAEEKKLLNEWYEFKVLGKNLKTSELLEKVIIWKCRFPFLSHLLTIISVLPTSTASCERGFSQMNLIKTDHRSSLEPSTLNDLLIVHLTGPELAEYMPQKAVDKWYYSAKKGRHVNNCQSQKRIRMDMDNSTDQRGSQ